MPRKSAASKKPKRAKLTPSDPTPLALVPRDNESDQLRSGRRFVRARPRADDTPDRATGPMPHRLESLLAQHGPTAVAFLCDTVCGRIPMMTNAQRLDAATTIATLVSEMEKRQVDAFAALIQHVDISSLTDAQFSALYDNQHDAKSALTALLHVSTHPHEIAIVHTP